MIRIIAAVAALMLLAVPACAQSYDSGPLSVTAIPNSSSHAAGSSIGGLFTIPFGRSTGNSSGIMTGVQWKSTGGSTGQIVVRAWSKKPSNPAFQCQDQVAYAGADSATTAQPADDAYLIVGFPLALTPAAPAVTTGDSATYASTTVQTFDFHNDDNPPTPNIYFCVTTVATDTADENALVRLTIAGPQN